MNQPTLCSIQQEDFEGAQTYVLAEPSTGSRARVVPGIGNNVLSFETSIGGRALGVIAPPPSIATLREHPTWYSTPVLFPYPGRIAGARFSFRGREYRLSTDDGQGNALHGPVNSRPWRVIAANADAVGATLVADVGTDTNPDMLEEWPFPFRLTESVHLSYGKLRIDLEATNIGDSAMPMGLGLHPYFATPLAGRGSRSDNYVAVAAEKLWAQTGGLPTGETTDLSEPNALVPSRLGDLGPTPDTSPSPLNLLYTALDATRGRPTDAPGGIAATIRDVDQTVEVQMETSATFRALVLFTPPWTTDLSLEPHTCTPDAFNLESRGVEAGVIVLEPGESWRGWVTFSARAL